MAGGNDINNELTLDVSNFTAGLEKANKGVDRFDDRLGGLDNKLGQLEKELKNLGNNAKQTSDKLGAVTQNLDGLAGGLDRVQKSAGKASDGSKRFSGDLSELVKQARESDAAMASVGDWTKFYGKSLDTLRPKMEQVVKSQKELATVTANSTKAEAKAIQGGLESRIKALDDERKLNEQRIKARQDMIAQLEQLERRAESSAAFARADAYKTNAKGKEVRRYVGKNSGRHSELMAEVDAYKQQAALARQQKQHISAIVGEMEFRNSELSQALKSEQALLAANKETLRVQKQQREETARQTEAKKEQAAREKELARQVSAEKRAQAKIDAAAEKQAQREILAAQRQAHKEIMQMRRDELQMHKDMAAFATGTATAGATAAGVRQIADYQNTDVRVKALNLSDDEYKRFQEKAFALSATEKYLSRTDALQARLDALTAIGHNKESTIDATVGSASRNAYILRSTGYEAGSMSDITKNLYGFAEARQVMDNPDEVNASFDIARRMAVASGGKIKMADIETVARNIGDLRQTMSSEGWVRLAAIMEQFKTAGGGNGGGGGVASVGTIFKMMGLYASGKPLTNRAALNMMGADVLNEVYQDGSAQDFKNGKEANAAFMQAVKFAGFKDVKSMSQDPVKFFSGLRGQLLDFMMQDGQFKKFFGADAQKHTYDKEGRMIGADGKVVDQTEQDITENAAFKRLFAQMGLSNKAIDGLSLMTNRAFAKRSYDAADTALNGQDETQIMQELSGTWTANMNELKASLADFAVTFEPLLRQLTAIPSALSSVIRGLSDFGKAHNGIASLALGFLGVKVAMAALNGPMGMFAKSILFNGGLSKAKVGLDVISAAAMGASGKMGQTASAAENMAGRTATASKAAGDALAGSLATGAAQATTATKGGVVAITRVLGTLLNWAGWLMLAGMLGWAIGKWIGDIQVGGITINQHMQNLFNDIFTGWDNLILNMRGAWQSFLSVFGAQNDQIRRQITETQRLVNQQNAAMHIASDDDAKNDLSQEYASQFKKIADSKKAGSFTIGGVRYFNISPQDAQKNYDRLSRYDANGLMPLTLPQSGFMGTKDGSVISEMNNKILSSIDNETIASRNARNQKPKEKVHTEPPPSFKPTSTGAVNPNITAPVLPSTGGVGGRKTPRQEFTPQSAYDVSLANLKNESSKDISRLSELQGIPVDYNWLAKQAFIKEWMQGKLDDGRDPTKRPFANRAYSKGKAWTEADINWDDPKVKQWVNLSKTNLTNDGIQKALEYAAGKIGEASSNMETAVENWNQGTDTPSDTAKANREFAKFEYKNPTATKNYAYKAFKGEALAKIAGTNYAEMAANLRDQNKELNDSFLENETQATRNAEKRRFESETKKIQAVRDSLNEQIEITKAAYGEDNTLYKNLMTIKKGMDDEYTKYLENQNKLRVKNTRSAFDQTMAQWRDLETNLNNTFASFGERAGTDIWDIITGEQDLDINGFLADFGRQAGRDMFKSAWGTGAKFLMGEGEGTNVLDMFKNIASGNKLNESGWLGRYLNQSKESGGVAGTIMGGIQSIFGKFFGGPTAGATELTGDQAINANTSALQQLTSAILGKGSVGGGIGDGINIGDGVNIGAAINGAAINGADNASAIDVIGGNGMNLYSTIGATGVPSEMNSGDFSYAFGNLGEGAVSGEQAGGLFDSLKTGFTNLFSSTGEGGVFNSIKSGFTNLFSNSGGLMSQIGGSFGSIFSSLGSIVGNLFGGSGAGGKIGGALSGAMQGYATGGWAGAAIGGISALFSANGNAFGGSGHIKAFANGGAFTNGLYDSPTLFKFANGGGFSQGVMGEAGPEAVMPLQRDSSGRLGVAVNGGSGSGMTNNVSISINVDSNGASSETASGSESQQWKSMSNKVRMVVLEELVKQKRPGGALS